MSFFVVEIHRNENSVHHHFDICHNEWFSTYIHTLRNERRKHRCWHKWRTFHANLERRKKFNKAVYTEGLVACCWAGAVTILYTRHRALPESLLIVSIALIVLSCQFGSFSHPATDGPTDRPTVAYRVACTRLKTVETLEQRCRI